MTSVTLAPEVTPTMIARSLVDRLEELTDRLVAMIRSGEHAYAESTLLSEDELRGAVRENLDSVLRQMCGETELRLDEARAVGRLKAGYGVPLPALLHAYRLAGRLVWDELRLVCGGAHQDLLPGIGADVWRIIDEYSTAATEEYGRVIAERTQRDCELRRVQLRALLDGMLDAGRMHAAATVLQLPTTGTFLVVVAESGDDGEPLAGIEAALRERYVTSHWLTEVHRRVGLLSLSTEHSAGPAREVLARDARGRVGISSPFTQPADAAAALRQAELAMRSADPGSVAAVTYGQSAVPLLLAHAPDAGREFRDAVLGPVLALPEPDRAQLLGTLHAWFACDGSLSATAARLHYHRNTINHRLRRIEELTGRDRSDPRAVAELYLAARAARLLPDGQRPNAGFSGATRPDSAS